MEGRPRPGRRFWEEVGEEQRKSRSPSLLALPSPSPSHQPLRETRQSGSQQQSRHDDPHRATLNPEEAQLPTDTTEEESSSDLRKLMFSVEEGE